MIIDTNNICIYYSLFILFVVDIFLIEIYLKFVLAIKTIFIINNNLDYCKHINNSSYFCKSYYSIIDEKNILKFGFIHYINVLSYQKYFNIFNNLTFVKKAFISYVYPIISIINIKSYETSLTALYYRI